VRPTLARVALLSSSVIVGFGTLPCVAQTRVTSLDELRRELATGDVITVVATDGQPVAGRLMRLGTVDLDVRLADTRGPGPREVTVALDAIRSLERRPDSARNGAVLGAGIGAGIGGAMFIHALVVDRNEIDEWAPHYAAAAAICTGIGALVGWAVDAAKSKPHVRFDVSSEGRTKVSVRPAYAKGRGIALTVSFAR
jgi:hypothetical protein